MLQAFQIFDFLLIVTTVVSRKKYSKTHYLFKANVVALCSNNRPKLKIAMKKYIRAKICCTIPKKFGANRVIET